MIHNCRVCGDHIVVGDNITQYRIDHYQYICQTCQRKYGREYAREYYQEHREHVRERRREYYQDHREHAQKYYQEHREQIIERQNEYNHRIGRHQPMSENRQCPSFLGVHVAEHVLSHVFENVDRMPYGNVGFDFLCGHGHMIEVKSSCRRIHVKHADNWMFTIRKNPIAEYFLLLAFDNRNDLNPEHVWLIPAIDINDHVTISISETTLDKWDQYKLDVDKVSACCNIIKGQ